MAAGGCPTSESRYHAVSHGSWGHHGPHVHSRHRVGAGEQKAVRLRGSANRRGRGDAPARELRGLWIPGLPPVCRSADQGRGAAGQVHGELRRGKSGHCKLPRCRRRGGGKTGGEIGLRRWQQRGPQPREVPRRADLSRRSEGRRRRQRMLLGLPGPGRLPST
jgi:hypothetical protein